MNMNASDGEILRAFADSGMRNNQAAAALHYSNNAIGYRLRKIKEKTGLNPFDFWDLVRLLCVAESEVSG